MKDIVKFLLFIQLFCITLAIFLIPLSRRDLEGKSVVIHKDTLVITNAEPDNVLHLSNGAEITVELAEKYLID